jgi:glycosyltransferase involved in cell wall biosynthesis
VPKISILLSSYNHAKYLREAIDSVLNQTFEDFELVISDDASTDDSWNIITSYNDPRIRAIRSEVNCFAGISIANRSLTSDFIAIHHSDDVWEPSKLAEQFSFLHSNPDIAAVFTNATPIGENGEVFTDKKHFYFSVFDQPNRSRQGWLNRFYYVGNCLCHPSVLMRRKAFEESGGYRHGLFQLSDFDLWVRLCLANEIYVLPKRLTRFRIRGNEANISGDKATSRIRWRFEFSKVLENYRRIADIHDLLAVFPKARQYHSVKGFNIDFLLAMVAIDDGPWVFTKLFGLNLLFELLNNSDSANAIKEIYGFDAVKFVEITGANDIFSTERLAELEAEKIVQNQALGERAVQLAELNETLLERDRQLFSFNERLASRDAELGSLKGDLVDLKLKLKHLASSRSWRLTRPLRALGRFWRGDLKTAEMMTEDDNTLR